MTNYKIVVYSIVTIISNLGVIYGIIFSIKATSQYNNLIINQINARDNDNRQEDLSLFELFEMDNKIKYCNNIMYVSVICQFVSTCLYFKYM